MKTYTDRILRYFSKLSGNTQSCKQEAFKEQNTTGREKIRPNFKKRETAKPSIVFGMRMSNKLNVTHCRKDGKTPEATSRRIHKSRG